MLNKETFLRDNGLDFDVVKNPMAVINPIVDDYVPIKDYFALTRPDTNKIFTVVGKTYRVFSNSDLYDLGARICENTGLQMDMKGYNYRYGSIVGLNIQLGENDPLAKFGQSDKISRSLMVINSFDQSHAIRIITLDKRMACMNQLAHIGKRIGGINFRIPHTPNMHKMVEHAVKGITAIQGNQGKINTLIGSMYECTINHPDVTFDAFLRGPLDLDPSDKGYHVVKDNLMQGYRHRTNDPISGTLWGWFNGVSYYTDHLAPIRKGTNKDYNIMFGSRGAMKNRAWNFAIDLLKTSGYFIPV
jgi:hypothetical protein